MVGKHRPVSQMELFGHRLDQIINPEHPLCRWSREIDWDGLEAALGVYYASGGRPGIPIRMMAAMSLLKYRYGLGDESLLERWVENPYWQFFTGEAYFRYNKPFDGTDLVYFRKRIGQAGIDTLHALLPQQRMPRYPKQTAALPHDLPGADR